MARLFKISRWLRPYESKHGHQIFIRVRMSNGFETQIPVYDYVNHQKLPISVAKQNWSKGYVTGGRYHISLRDINHLLSNVEYRVKDAVNELIEKRVKITQDNILKLTYINELTAEENERKIKSGEIIVDEQGGAFSSQDEFEEYIENSEDPKFDALKKAMGIYQKEYILDYWDDFIKDYAPDSYNSVRCAIEDYIKNTDDNCRVSEFSSDWLKRFFAYTIKNGYSFRKDRTDRKDYTITTINKYHKHLKYFGKYLFEELKLIDNEDYKRFDLRKKSKKQSLIRYQSEPYINTQALYKIEFDKFYFYKFEDNELNIVRDMFVLQTWLGGLRKSDFFKISEINFHRDSNGKYRVWFEQQKTEDDVLNVVNQNYLIPIFEKNIIKLKEFPDVSAYNSLLKKAAKVAGLDRKLKFRYEIAKNAQPTIEWHPIYEKISNNWARNCAVSILAEEGYPDDWICKFTGHRDREMIRHYKDIHQKEINTMMDNVKPLKPIE